MRSSRAAGQPGTHWGLLRYFLAFFLPGALVLGGVTAALLRQKSFAETVLIGGHEQLDVMSGKNALRARLSAAVSDLRFLARMSEFITLDTGGDARAREAREDLEQRFIALASAQRGYDQIRFLDETGLEIIRVNFGADGPTIVPEEKLQNNSKRYDVAAILALGGDEVYLSRVDPHVEHGKIEQPLKLVLRLGTRVVDGAGRTRGILVFNCLAEELIRALDIQARLDGLPPLMLVDAAGEELRTVSSGRDGGSALSHRRSFRETFPDAWARISKTSAGQFRNAAGLFTFQTVCPLSQAMIVPGVKEGASDGSHTPDDGHEVCWAVVAHMPAPHLAAVSNRLLREVVGAYGVLLVLLAVGSFGLARAVAHRRRAERELRAHTTALESINVALERANARAETATRTKSDFLANMSHEVRTPMTAILGFADTLHEARLSDLALRDAVDTIRRNGDYLLTIINDILDMSKIEAGKFQIERTRCSPLQVVTDATSLMDGRAEKKGLSLTVEFDGAVPETIHTDALRLRQILINLVGNAIKFTQKGGVRVIVRLGNGSLRAASAGDRFPPPGETHPQAAGCPNAALPRRPEHPREPQMQFDVVDTGIGIAPGQIPSLFEPFTQAEASSTGRFGGTGLGLTISKRLAQMLGGDIQVESEPGVGSTFRVCIAAGSLDGIALIANPTMVVKAQAHDGAGTTSTPDIRLSGHILLAEDGVDNQRLISRILERAGATVTIVENGELAVQHAMAARDATAEQLCRQPFDVILMDMQMPVLDGYAATRRLRDAQYTQPIIALTAHAMEGDREKCLQAGCDDYILKPIDRVTFLATIAQYMQPGVVTAD